MAAVDLRIHELVERLEGYLQQLAGFATQHSLANPPSLYADDREWKKWMRDVKRVLPATLAD